MNSFIRVFDQMYFHNGISGSRRSVVDIFVKNFNIGTVRSMFNEWRGAWHHHDIYNTWIPSMYVDDMTFLLHMLSQSISFIFTVTRRCTTWFRVWRFWICNKNWPRALWSITASFLHHQLVIFLFQRVYVGLSPKWTSKCRNFGLQIQFTSCLKS